MSRQQAKNGFNNFDDDDLFKVDDSDQDINN